MKRIFYILMLIIAGISISNIVLLKKKEHQATPLPLESIGVKGEKHMIPNDWFAYQRIWPHKTMNKKAMLDGLKQAQLMPERKGDYTWELLGPTNVGGRIVDIEFHPEEPEVLYVGGATGGVFKTENSGLEWVNVSVNMPNVNIGDICIDPNQKETVWVGTGEPNNASLSYYGDGIYKSENGGETWEHKGLENSNYIARIVVDYANSDRLFVAACGDLFSPSEERGIYRSTDGGDSWERVLFVTDTTAAIDLVQHPSNPDILYAGMWERTRGFTTRRSFGLSTGIYRTTDGGDTWEELTNGLPQGEAGRVGIAIAKTNPNVLYAWYDMPYKMVEVYRSDDGGDTWQQKPSGELEGMNSSFGWYFGQIHVDPNDENRLYLLGMALWRSDNGGDDWILLADYGNMQEIHVDHHAMKSVAATGKLWEGNDGGLYYSNDYGDTWTKVNNLPITQPYAIDVSQQNPEKIICGTQDNGSNLTLFGEDQWEHILGGDGMYCRIDHSFDEIYYAESQWGNLYRFSGGWADYIAYEPSGDSPRINWSAPLELDPVNSTTLYFGTYRVWKSTSAGDSWDAISGDLTSGTYNSSFYTLTTIGVHPLNTDIIIAGSADGKVHVTSNGGQTWRDCTEGLPGRWITKVIGDPFDENTLYVTMSGLRWSDYLSHVYMSHDLGETWIDISSNLPELPAHSILADPENEGHLFIGMDAGVYYTKDYGENWIGINNGIAKVAVVDLRLQRETRQLYMAGYGTSLYRLKIDDLGVGMEETAAHPSAHMELYPNPAANGEVVTIPVSIATQGYAQVSLTDLSGREVASIFKGSLASGKTNLQWTPENLPAGYYLCLLRWNGETVTQKLVIK